MWRRSLRGCLGGRVVALIALMCLLLLAFGLYPARSSSTHTFENMSDMEYASFECQGTRAVDKEWIDPQ